jgi:hypothetical protein
MSTNSKLTEKDVADAYNEFSKELQPFEVSQSAKALFILEDARTGAKYCECHIKADKLIEFGTTDVPLDPEEQPEYRANRELVTNAVAFATMKEDAKNKRSFSNIVAEYNKEFEPEKPLKIIGGQHRFQAIKLALEDNINEYHGVKVYLGLNMDQRLDVQLISNTNIAISTDLFDRMQETFKGPELRNWCQAVGLLQKGEDFADRRSRGGTITVQVARSFITNFFAGKAVDTNRFDVTDTTPTLSPTGQADEAWEELRSKNPYLWKDEALAAAAKEFAELIKAQRNSFAWTKPKPPVDYPEKTLNAAVLSAWAYVSGVLQKNATRLKRHYVLRTFTGRDPLNAAALAKGRHKTDPENYRGLGYRTDAKERGRLVELFYSQAEDGKGITASTIDVAIKKYHAKQAQLDVMKAKAKA